MSRRTPAPDAGAPLDGPRERLARSGARALADAELLAVVLGSGIRGHDAVAIADAVLQSVGGLGALATLPIARLTRSAGVGPARAARVVAAIELGRRALAVAGVPRPRLGSPAAVADYLRPRLGRLREEHFGVLLLDTRHRVIRAVVVSMGSLDASLVHPREVFRPAAEHSAAALVLFHNHPSGDPTPSADDLALTRRLVQAGELMGIAALDHVILGDGCWHSLRESAPALFER
jgi:DNA repair protein RadC